jgi:hypothetical protein
VERKTSWGQKRIEGRVYDLSHLDAFVFSVTPKSAGSPTFKVAVFFGCHTFTKKFRDGDPPDLVMVSERVRRTFCTVRYQQSLNLRAIIQDAPNRKAFFSHNENYVLVARLDEHEDDYAIAFDVLRANRKGVDVVMNVLSAHTRDNGFNRIDTIPFTTLVAKTSRGEAIERP